MIKILAAIGLFSLLVISFLLINLAHFRFLPVEVVLYDTLLDALLAAVLVSGAAFLLRRRLPLTGLETTLSLMLGCSIAGAYAITVPTVIDRSLSMYILEKLDQRGGAIQKDAFEGIFVNEYMKEHRLVDIRLTEQLASRTIEIRNGCVTLTERGRRIAYLTRLYRTTILPKRRQIMGAYTDDLTDPFRNSSAADYRCSPDGGSAKTK